MKKLTLFVLALIFAAGCSGPSPSSSTQEALRTQDDVENPWGIQLSAEDVTSTGMTLMCTQSGGNPSGELCTGSRFWIDIWTDGQWEPVDTLEDTLFWTAIALSIPSNDSTRWTVDWENVYGELAPGTYRIGKEFLDIRQPGDFDKWDGYTQFEIAP